MIYDTEGNLPKKADIYDILLNLFVNKNSNVFLYYGVAHDSNGNPKKEQRRHRVEGSWINFLENEDIQPYVLQLWLVMNDSVRAQTRWLDKYVFSLPPKMYLSLAWSVLPKVPKMPYSKYIKKLSEIEEYDFILSKVRQHLNLSDNDFNANKDRLLTAIKSDMVNWFSFYGVPKKYWKKYYLNFDLIKNFRKKEDNSQKGLGAWGL